jgi:hypothetical protein
MRRRNVSSRQIAMEPAYNLLWWTSTGWLTMLSRNDGSNRVYETMRTGTVF